MLEKLRSVDQQIFLWFREHFQSPFTDDWSLWLGNVYLWTPLLVFLGFLVYMQRPQRGLTNLLFAVACLILSYQAAFLLSFFIAMPAPYVVEHLTGGQQLPGFRDIYLLSFPDWTIAAFIGGVSFVQFRLLKYRRMAFLLWATALLIISFFRIMAGNAYPSDIIFGIFVGSIFGWVFNRFIVHFDYLAQLRKGE